MGLCQATGGCSGSHQGMLFVPCDPSLWVSSQSVLERWMGQRATDTLAPHTPSACDASGPGLGCALNCPLLYPHPKACLGVSVCRGHNHRRVAVLAAGQWGRLGTSGLGAVGMVAQSRDRAREPGWEGSRGVRSGRGTKTLRKWQGEGLGTLGPKAFCTKGVWRASSVCPSPTGSWLGRGRGAHSPAASLFARGNLIIPLRQIKSRG